MNFFHSTLDSKFYFRASITLTTDICRRERVFENFILATIIAVIPVCIKKNQKVGLMKSPSSFCYPFKKKQFLEAELRCLVLFLLHNHFSPY